MTSRRHPEREPWSTEPCGWHGAAVERMNAERERRNACGWAWGISLGACAGMWTLLNRGLLMGLPWYIFAIVSAVLAGALMAGFEHKRQRLAALAAMLRREEGAA